MIKILDYALKKHISLKKLVIENTSHIITNKYKYITNMIYLCEKYDINICFDTAHAFSSGLCKDVLQL